MSFYPPFVVESSAQQMTDMFPIVRTLRPRSGSDAEFGGELNRLRGDLSIDRGSERTPYESSQRRIETDCRFHTPGCWCQESGHQRLGPPICVRVTGRRYTRRPRMGDHVNER
jgi:hypothetical protein